MKWMNGWRANLLRSIAGGIFCCLLVILWEVKFDFEWYQGVGSGIALGMIVIMWR